MIPTQLFLNTIAALLAADPSGFADPTTFLKVSLVMNAFTPGPTLVLADMTVATFVTSTPLHAHDDTPLSYTDPNTGEEIVEANAPIGGWHWQATATTNLPQTIYGWFVTDHTGANLLGAELLPTPVTLSAVGQGFDIDAVRIRIANNVVS